MSWRPAWSTRWIGAGNRTCRAQAGELLDRYSLRATQFVLEKAREFARQNDKKLLVVLFDPYRAMAEMRQSGKRFDQPVVDYLIREKFEYFDMNEVQLRDFQKYKLPYEDYMKQYFIGHYNPRGNHFFAYAIKDHGRPVARPEADHLPEARPGIGRLQRIPAGCPVT